MIYTALNSPLAIFQLRSYLVQMPRDFEDAARVDGAGELQIITRVILPLAWPGFLTVGLVVALGVWSEFQIALVFIHNPDFFPVTTSYYSFTSRFDRDWALTSAAAVMMIAPVLILFLSLQRRFVEGLTQGGLKI
jgi:raffinose/stachyose/melibiose transport system permease protein